MTPRDGFGIIVRTAGLYVLLHAARNAFTAVSLGGSAGLWFWLHLIVALIVYGASSSKGQKALRRKTN